jgi:TrmH family RNA methyltransferase
VTATLSPTNPRVKRLRRLARDRAARDGEGVFVIEGPKLVEEALQAGLALESVFVEQGTTVSWSDPARVEGGGVGGRGSETLLVRAGESGATVHELAPGGLRGVVTATTPQPVAALARTPAVGLAQILDADLVVVLVDLADPGNAGTVLRTAEAAGAGGVVVCGGAVDPFSPKCVRASAGAVFHVPVVPAADPIDVLGQLGRAGLARLATVVESGDPYDHVDLRGPTALVLGSEAHGLPAGLAPFVDKVVTIPMAGRSQSLNVAMAGAVLCFEALRQRRATEPAP